MYVPIGTYVKNVSLVTYGPDLYLRYGPYLTSGPDLTYGPDLRSVPYVRIGFGAKPNMPYRTYPTVRAKGP